MPLSDRDIIITPNRGASSEPIITLRGADVASSATMVMRVINSGTISTLSFEGTSGQLFAISDTLTGSIFSVNDVSGIPSIEVLDSGLIRLAEYNGFVRVGSAVNNENATSATTGELQVVGGVGVSRDVFVGGAMTVVGTLNAAVIAGSITNAANIGITDDPSNGATMYPTFVSATSGNQAIRVDSSGLVWIPSTNRLGIGTTTPTTSLDVRGNILLKGDATDGGVLSITRRYSIGPQTINFNNNHPGTNLDWTGARITSADSGNYNGYLDFAVSLGNNANETAGTAAVTSVMRLNAAGNVGIGITSPTQKLEVYTGAGYVTASTNDGVGSNGGFGYQLRIANTNHVIAQLAGVYTNSGSNGSGGMFISTRNAGTLTERLRINEVGNVGIGISTPTNTLHVLGQQANTSNTNVSSPSGTLRLDCAAAGTENSGIHGASLVFTQRWFNGNLQTIATGQITGVKVIGNGQFGGGLAFWTSDGQLNQMAERLRIDQIGNVGIGTTSPNRKLTISRASEAASEQLEFRVEGGISTGNHDGIVWTQGATGATTLGSIRLNYNSSGQPDMAFNLRADSNLLFLRNGGSVGISTSAPAAKLHIVSSTPTGIGAVPAGTTAIMDAVGNNYLLFRSTADNNSRAGLVFQDNNVGGFVVFNNFSGVNGSDSMIYGTWQDHIFVNGTSETIGMGGKTERMRITNAGGISFNAAGTGTSGQILQSNGNAPPTWVNPSAIAGGNADLLDGLDSTAFLRRDITNTMFAGQTSSLAFENQTTFFRFAFNELRFWDNQVGDIFGLDEHAYATTSMRAPIFFDRDNTAFFIDPNGTSNVSGNFVINHSGSSGIQLRSTTGTQSLWIRTGWDLAPTPSVSFNNVQFQSSGSSGGSFTFYSGNTLALTITGDHAQGSASLRAPIFFDSNDTAFYVDPNTTALSINVRGEIRNPSIWINDGDNSNSYNENIRLFNAPNGVSVIAFSASGTSGTPTTSILGYSDRMERRFQDNWQDRMFNGFVEASGSYRAPIFFDSNNTAFFTDPASTSVLNNLTVTGTTNLGSSVVVSGNNVLTTNLNTTAGDRGWDLHGNPAMQAIYGNHNPLNSGHIYNAALFRGGSWTMYGFNGTSWINLGTVAALTDGYGKNDWGGVQLARIYSQFIIDMGSTLGYTFMSALTLSHSTNGNSMNIFFENSTSNVYNSGTWNVMGQALGANSWPGGTSIKFSDVVGASFPNFARLRIVPTWGGLGNEISLGQLFITAAYGGGNQLLEWDSSYNVTAAGSYRSPIFFDSNNTAFYLDPNSTTISLNMAGSVRQATHNRAGILSVASGTASTGASFAIQQETGEGWTGIFVDFEPNTGWGLYHDNPNNFFSFTAETATGSIRSFAVPSRTSGNRTAHEKFRVDQTSGDTITGAIGFANSSFRAPIFFDNNDTTYFMDPATNSRFGGQVVIAGNASGSAGNRLIVGSTTVNFSLQDGNLRPTIQATGQYPVISLNHTVTSNTNHGGTLQFTCNGVGNQFVIGTTGNGFALDMGYSSSGDWNPHNGIAGYLGTTFFRANTSGNIGIGAQGDWGGLGGGDPAWPIDTRGTLVNNTDIRAPIFYDSNNTAFYLDPTSESRQARVRVGPYAGSVSSGNVTGLELVNNGGTGDNNVAAMSFHCAGQYAVHLHLRADSFFGMGGWSASSWRWYVQASTGNMTAAGEVTAYSDPRLKENIEKISSPLERISKLSGVRFKWKDISVIGNPGSYDYGVIADEVEEQFPELVYDSAYDAPEGDKYKTVAYSKFVPILIEAIKEQQTTIDQLRAELDEMRELKKLVKEMLGK